MSERKALITELLQLQEEYRKYIAGHGFDYQEYIKPTPGSYLERYKKRLAEINAVIAPELHYYTNDS